MMQPWMVRLKEEYSQLNQRIEKLERFEYTSAYAELSNDDKSLLKSQRLAMRKYLSVLKLRCNLHNINIEEE